MYFNNIVMLLSVFGVVMTLVAYVAALFQVRKIRHRRHLKRPEPETETRAETEALSKFTSALLTGLSNGIVSRLADAEQVYEGTVGAVGTFITYLSLDLEFALQRVFAELLLADSSFVPDSFDEQDRAILAEKTKSLIAESQAELPFAGIPRTERGLLTDVLRFAEAGDTDSVRRRLDELATSILTRMEDMDQIKGTARLSMWLASLGLLATLVMGFATILS